MVNVARGDIARLCGALALIVSLMAVSIPAQSAARSAADATARVACTWQLVDMVPSGQSGMQYVDGIGQFDDDADTFPSRLGCAGDLPDQQESINRTIQVTANPNDNPGRRSIELWAAVDYETGIDTVGVAYWDVFYPDGSFKQRVEADKVNCTDHGIGSAGGDVSAGSMFGAAIGTGQMDAAASRALVARCAAGAGGLYQGAVTLSATEPCGQYRVDAQAASEPGIDVLTAYFDNVCIQHVGIDFDSIAWGQITAGESRVLEGDLVVAPDSSPTANNLGSGGLNLGVAFSPMEPVNATGGPAGGAAITEFGAAFGVDSTALQSLDQISAGSVVWFDNADEQTLCTGETGRLDLKVHAPDDLADGVYHGSIQVLGRPDTGDGGHTCNNDKGVWGGEAAGFSNQRNAGVFVAAPAPIDVATVVLAVSQQTPSKQGNSGSGSGNGNSNSSGGVVAAPSPAPAPAPVDVHAPPTDVLPTRGEGLSLGATVVEVLGVSLASPEPLESGRLGVSLGGPTPSIGDGLGEASTADTSAVDDGSADSGVAGVVAAPPPVSSTSPSADSSVNCGAALMTQFYDVEGQSEIWTFLCTVTDPATGETVTVTDVAPDDTIVAAPPPEVPGGDETPPPTAGTGAPPAGDDAGSQPPASDDTPPTTEPPPTTTTTTLPPPPPEEKPFLIYAWLVIDEETDLALGYMYEFETESGERTEASLELLAFCDPLESYDEDADGFNDGDLNENFKLDEGEEWAFTCSEEEIPPELLIPGVGTFINGL